MSVATMTRRIDFNNPMTNKPANLQNSAVLRMLEEEENRKRGGQPGNLKRVAWPPPSGDLEEFVEQEPVHSQGGPLYSSPKSVQNNQAQPSPPPSKPQTQTQIQTQQSPSSPVVVQQQQQQQPSYQQQQQSPQIYATSANTFQPITSPAASTVSAQSVGQSTPLSPNISRSPVSFTNLAKPWSPQNPSGPQFKPVQPPSLRTIQTYHQQSSEQYHYTQQQHYQQEQTGETQKVYQTQQETSFQQYQTPPVEVSQSLQQEGVQRQDSVRQKQTFDLNQNKVEATQSVATPAAFKSSSSVEIQQEVSEPSTPIQTVPQSPRPIIPDSPLLKTVSPIQKPTPKPSEPSAQVAAKGVATNQAPPPQRYQIPAKPVEPPPSTITLRPQAPVSQAPPPLVTSQPATATLRGGKNLRGDLKWPPEPVKEKMAAEKQHLIELAKGPACRPRKNCKDYSEFFEKHALTHAYPGYKIPPGTQFYDHNPVM